MAGEIWLEQAAVGLQSSSTAVAATRRVYWRDPVLTREREFHPKDYATGRRASVMNAKLGAVVAGGRFVQEVSADENLETFLAGIQKNVTPVSLGGGAYRWVFRPANGPLQPLTIEGYDGAQYWQEANALINTLRIAGTPGNGENLITNELFATSRDVLATPALAGLTQRTPTSIEGYETRVYIDGFGTYGTTQVNNAVTAWDMTFDNNLGRKYFAMNTQNTGKVTVGKVGLELSINFEASEDVAIDEYDNWDAALKRTVELVFGGNEQIGTSGFYRTVAVVVNGAWSLFDTGQTGEGTREYQARLSGVYEPVMGDVIQVTVTNARATAG